MYAGLIFYNVLQIFNTSVKVNFIRETFVILQKDHETQRDSSNIICETNLMYSTEKKRPGLKNLVFLFNRSL